MPATDRTFPSQRFAYTWADRNPLFQTFSDHYLRQLAKSGATRKDRSSAKAELAFRAGRI